MRDQSLGRSNERLFRILVGLLDLEAVIIVVAAGLAAAATLFAVVSF